MHKHFLVFVALLLACVDGRPIYVTTVGDSITQGACGSEYPTKLQALLGPNYVVTNTGAGGQTQLKLGLCGPPASCCCSYWGTSQWAQTLQSQPDIVTIMLGTNDAKDFNWEGVQQNQGDYFALDYVDMIQRVQALQPSPKIFLMVPPPLYSPYPFQMNATIINTIFPVLVRNIAQVTGLDIIDIWGAFNSSAGQGAPLSCDGCHPTDEGFQLIADTMAPFILNAGKEILKQ